MPVCSIGMTMIRMISSPLRTSWSSMRIPPRRGPIPSGPISGAVGSGMTLSPLMSPIRRWSILRSSQGTCSGRGQISIRHCSVCLMNRRLLPRRPGRCSKGCKFRVPCTTKYYQATWATNGSSSACNLPTKCCTASTSSNTCSTPTPPNSSNNRKTGKTISNPTTASNGYLRSTENSAISPNSNQSSRTLWSLF